MPGRRRTLGGPRSRTGSIAPQAFRSGAAVGSSTAGDEIAEAAVVEFRDWLARDNEPRCILVEMDFVDEVAGAPVTDTVAFSDKVFFDDVTDQVYVDVVRSTPQYSRALSGERLGSYVSSVSTLELDNADGELDFMLDLACDGSEIRFKYGSPTWPLADFQLMFSAIVAKVTAPAEDRISVALKDTGLLLDKSLGGNTIGGGGPNDARARPINFGYIHNGEAILADPSLLKYVHTDDLTGAAVALAVRDKGAPLTPVTGFNDLGNGLVQLAATPAGTITCDVLSQPRGTSNVMVSDAIDHFVGTLAGLSAQGLYAGAGPTFQVHDEDDYKVGVRLPEARNMADLLGDLVIKTGNAFWAIKRTGEFTFGRLRLNDIASFGLEARTIVEDDIDDGTLAVEHATPQYYKFQASMSRNWTPQTEFAGSLSAEDQALYRRPGLYLMQPDGASNAYADRPELYHKTMAISPVIDTMLSEAFSATDVNSLAQWETTRRAAFLPWIEIVKKTVGIDFFELELGEPVRLTTSRFGQSAGALFQVIGIVIRLTDAKVDLTIARRNIIQAVPDSWRRLVSAQDHSQPSYTPGPPTIAPVDVSGDAIVGGGASNAKFIDRQGRFRITFFRPKLIVPPLHADVLLYVSMIGGNYQDQSIYANTATPTNFNASGDLFEVHYTLDTGTFPFTSKVRYGPGAAFNRGATDSFTIEGFFNWIDSENNAFPAIVFNWETNFFDGGALSDSRRFGLYGDSGKVQYNDSGFGVEAGGPSALGFSVNTLQHWAWVFDGTTHVHKFYIAGVEVMSYSGSSLGSKTNNTGGVEIGGQVGTNGFGPNNILWVKYGETRMVRRKLYTGAFTPPAPYNLSVIS